jgi:uridine phosphorylase
MILDPKSFVKYVLGEKINLLNHSQSALVCIDPSCYRFISKNYTGKKIRGLTGEVFLLQNNLVIGGLFGIGSPAAVAFSEELIACGIKRLVFLGTAGRLHNELKAADIVICDSALSEEGTSKCYPDWKEETFSSPGLTDQITVFLLNKGITVKKVKAWTTDAPYNETAEKLQSYLDKGADVVEMEASAVHAIAAYRNIQVALVFMISDSLTDGHWEACFDQKLFQEKLNKVAGNLVEFADV